MRYAQRFVEGKGLSWNDGHPVEGYSNLLWILGISALAKTGLDFILSARILGIICSLGTILSIINHFRKQKIAKEYLFLGIILLITTPCFAIWAIGGLEQPLYAFLLTLTIIEVSEIVNKSNFRRVYFLSLWLGLLALTRPDGFLFTMITFGFLFITYYKNKSFSIKICCFVFLIPALFLLLQLIFRYSYYGELVPNTALVKVKITLHHILRGGFYHVKAFFGTFLMSAVGLYFLYILVYRKKNVFGFYLLLNIIIWISYITLVGGDIFPAFRHYYIVLIFFVFSIITGLKYFDQIDFKNFKVKAIVIVILILNVFIQFYIPQNQYAKEERWEFEGMNLGKKLKNIFSNTTLIAVTAAGCIPYSSELPSVDMLGLNDYFLARNPPANFGNGALAHELGDANYVMRRNPDIIIISIGADLNFNIGNQLRENKIFNTNYIKVLAEEKEAKFFLFFNKYGKNTGVKINHQKLNIPGYLFKNELDSVSVFTKKKLLKTFEKGEKYSISLQNNFIKNMNFKNYNDEKSSLKTEIKYQNKQIEISVFPKKDTLIENLILKAEN